MADWYYAKNGQQQGPVNSAQLKQMAAGGQIGPDDLVFREGGTQWVAASTVAGLQFGGGNAPAPAPVAPSRVAPPSRGRKRDDFGDVGELPDEEEGGRVRARMPRGSGFVGDLLMFRQFCTPWMIIVIFWIGVLGILYFFGKDWFRLAYIISQHPTAYGFGFLLGFGLFILAALVYWRMVCEVIAVVFRIYETLLETVRQLQRLNGNKDSR